MLSGSSLGGRHARFDVRNPKAPLPPRLSQPDGYEVQSRPPPSAGSGVREQIEPEGFFDDAQDETRPALADEAKKALDMAEQRRKSLQPIIDKDAETAAMKPNDYHAALERLKAQRASQAPPAIPAADKTTRDRPKEGSDPSFALAQLAAARASAPPPPPSSSNGFSALSRPPSSNGFNVPGPNRPLSKESASAIPSARDLAANLRRSMVDVKPSSSPSVPPPVPVTDDPDVIKSLLGGAVPPASRAPQSPPQESITSHTLPLNLNQLGLKPSSAPIPLPPQRTPAPMAVGGKGGLMIQTDRPGSMPPAGFGFPKTQPSAPAVTRPQMPSRPPGAFGPNPSTPPKQYDFKRWSSPEISEMPSDGAPVTFQVYTAQDVAQGRGPMRSLPMIDPPQKSAGNIAMKVGLAVLGGVIVLITAAAVILVSTDEPKKQPVPAAPSSPSSAPASAELAPEAPPVLIIPGDPAPPEEEPAPATTAKKTPKAQPASGGGGGSKSSVTPPPNPYGKP